MTYFSALTICGKPASALVLCGRRLDQHDVRARCHGVRPFHVQCGFTGGAGPCFGRPVAGDRARWLDHPQCRRRRQAEPLVEDGQVVPDRRRSERLNDHNRLALAVDAFTQQRPQIVGRPDLHRAQAATRQTRGLGRPARSRNVPGSDTASAPRQSQAKRHSAGTGAGTNRPAVAHQFPRQVISVIR
jgi:hypothetical protein